jgi:hypothetical protein
MRKAAAWVLPAAVRPSGMQRTIIALFRTSLTSTT